MVFRSHVKWKDRKQIYTNFVEGVVVQILSPVYTKAHSDLLWKYKIEYKDSYMFAIPQLKLVFYIQSL